MSAAILASISGSVEGSSLAVYLPYDRQAYYYAPGDGTIWTFDDRTSAQVFDDLSPIQRRVMAERFRALADVIEGAS